MSAHQEAALEALKASEGWRLLQERLELECQRQSGRLQAAVDAGNYPQAHKVSGWMGGVKYASDLPDQILQEFKEQISKRPGQ